MAQTLNALIYPSAPTVVADRRLIDTAAIPAHKAAWWRPVVVVGDGTFDPMTQKKTGPVTTIQASQVVDTYSIVALTAQELDAIKELALDRFDKLSFELNFDQENRIRVLEAKPSITKAQYRAALKARL